MIGVNIYEEVYSSVGTRVDKHMLRGFCTWATIFILNILIFIKIKSVKCKKQKLSANNVNLHAG